MFSSSDREPNCSVCDSLVIYFDDISDEVNSIDDVNSFLLFSLSVHTHTNIDKCTKVVCEIIKVNKLVQILNIYVVLYC